MTNINQAVTQYLDNNHLIKKTLSLGLLNKRALALYIIKEQHLTTNVDAVISAIRRYDSEKYNDVYNKATNILKGIADISTRTNMIIITVSKESKILKQIPQFYGLIQHEKGELLRIAHANVNIKIMINKKNLDKITALIPKENIITIEEVAEINIQFNIRADKGPGPIALLTNELAIHDISIIEMITCFPEIIFFVFRKDLIKGYNALQQLCNP